jgi:hypothetical protein
MDRVLPQLRADILREAALGILRKNDVGGWTKPAPRLYPHQWSWDSALIAVGLVHIDADRAIRELETLFAAQWSDGRVPHIVFNPSAKEYFPGADWWASSRTSTVAPREPATSGLIQPPVHAIALARIFDVVQSGGLHALEPRIRDLYPRFLAWHRYLVECRDATSSGLLTIYHPWESGTDNSPRWDSCLARLEVGDMPGFERHDLKHVEDPAERPTHLEYHRYLWLVHLLKQANYSDEVIQRDFPFQIGDVLMSAIFAAANHCLAGIAAQLARPHSETDELLSWSDRFRRGVERAWDDQLGLALDWDAGVNAPVRVQTCAGLSPLLLPDLSDAVRDGVMASTFGPRFAGADGLAYGVVPSTAPGSPGFHARSYWRGPTWPVANWLLWWGMLRQGFEAQAEAIRIAYLELLEHPEAQFAEYFDPFTAEPLGSREQSWTASIALDWLAHTR